MPSHKAGVASLWKVCKAVVPGTHGSAQHVVIVITTATHQTCHSDMDRKPEGGAQE